MKGSMLRCLQWLQRHVLPSRDGRPPRRSSRPPTGRSAGGGRTCPAAPIPPGSPSRAAPTSPARPGSSSSGARTAGFATSPSTATAKRPDSASCPRLTSAEQLAALHRRSSSQRCTGAHAERQVRRRAHGAPGQSSGRSARLKHASRAHGGADRLAPAAAETRRQGAGTLGADAGERLAGGGPADLPQLAAGRRSRSSGPASRATAGATGECSCR
jgi:hypothetical protein